MCNRNTAPQGTALSPFLFTLYTTDFNYCTATFRSFLMSLKISVRSQSSYCASSVSTALVCWRWRGMLPPTPGKSIFSET